jgi:hypothetical protein
MIMSKEAFVFLIGFIVLLSPFLGVPRMYHEWLLIVCGVLLMGVGYQLRRRAFLHSIEHESGEKRGEAFVENAFVNREKIVTPKDDSGVI